MKIYVLEWIKIVLSKHFPIVNLKCIVKTAKVPKIERNLDISIEMISFRFFFDCFESQKPIMVVFSLSEYNIDEIKLIYDFRNIGLLKY